MTQYTADQIKERFDKLPQELKDAIASTDVHDELKNISAKYGLHIDQQGELIDQVGLVMLGLTSAKDFVSSFSQSTDIDQATALKIANDINSQILDKIRSSMRTLEATKPSDNALNALTDQIPGMRAIGSMPMATAKPNILSGIPSVPKFVGGTVVAATTKEEHVSSLERAGGFSIEREVPRKSINLFANDVNEKDKPAILSSIENPVPPAGNVPPKDNAAAHYEPLVDQLLRGPAATLSARAYPSQPVPAPAVPKPPMMPEAPAIPRPPSPLAPAPIIPKPPIPAPIPPAIASVAIPQPAMPPKAPVPPAQPAAQNLPRSSDPYREAV